MSVAPRTSLRHLRAEQDVPLQILDLGMLEYRPAWELQQRIVARRTRGETGDTVVMVEHAPVYTLGRRASAGNVLLDGEQLSEAGIDVIEVDRGGDVTYHGPGQLVVYPIVMLAAQRQVVDFVRALEEIAIAALLRLGVEGRRREGLTGVWVGREKIVAIGVRVGAGGVTSHGLAINVAPDLQHFGGIVPCGLATEGVTSLAALGMDAEMSVARAAVRATLADLLQVDLLEVASESDPDLSDALDAVTTR